MSIDVLSLTAVNPVPNAKGLASSKNAKDTSLAVDSNPHKKSFNELLLGLEPVGLDSGFGAAEASQPDVNTQIDALNLQADNVATLLMQQNQIPTTLAMQSHAQVDRDALTSANLKKLLTTLDGKGLPKTPVGYVHNAARDASEIDALDPLVAGLLDRSETGEVGLVSGGARTPVVQKPFAASLSDSVETSGRNLVGRTSVALDALEPFVAGLLDTTKNRDFHSGRFGIVSVKTIVPIVFDLQESGAKHAVGSLAAEFQDKLHANIVDISSWTDKVLVARINLSHAERKTTGDESFNFGLLNSVGARAGRDLASFGGGTFQEFFREKPALKSSAVEVGGAVSQGWESGQSGANVEAPFCEGEVGAANEEQTPGASWGPGEMRSIEMTLDGVGEGSVEVSISLHGKQTHVSFRTDEGQTRAALEGTGSTLKDMLHREGLELSAVSGGSASSHLGGGASGGQEPRRQDDFRSFKMESKESGSEGEQLQGRANQKSGSLDVFV